MRKKNGLSYAVLGLVLVLGPACAVQAAELNVDEQIRYRDLDARPIDQCSNVDLSVYLGLRNKLLSDSSGRPPPARDIATFALKAVRQPYTLNALSFDNSEADCVTFCERAIALALANDWNSYYLIRQRLRFKGDSFNFFDSNFFTLSEWVPNNAWLLDDITTALAPSQTFTSVAWPRAFLRRLKFRPDETDKLAQREIRVQNAPKMTKTIVSYVPRGKLDEITPLLRTGDIALIIRRFEKAGLAPWFDCDHMGIIVCDPDGSVTLVHCAPPRARQQPLSDFLTRHTRIDGLKFLRVRDDAWAARDNELQRLTATHSTVLDAPARDRAVSLARARRAQVQQ